MQNLESVGIEFILYIGSLLFVLVAIIWYLNKMKKPINPKK